VIRPVRAQDKALIESGWQNYLNYAKQYKQLPAVEDPH